MTEVLAVLPPTRSRRGQWLQDVGLVGLLMMVASVPGYIVYAAWAADRAERATWNIVGPPCPVVSQPSRLAVGRRPPKRFQYGESTFTRSFAAVSCAAFSEGAPWTDKVYRVCQFNNPGAVTVVTAGRRVVFEALPGRRVTVMVRDGKAACAVAGWFNL
jgi:hypothetical protein